MWTIQKGEKNIKIGQDLPSWLEFECCVAEQFLWFVQFARAQFVCVCVVWFVRVVWPVWEGALALGIFLLRIKYGKSETREWKKNEVYYILRSLWYKRLFEDS